MNLRNIDLSLLASFLALIEERSVSRAAERMFMTQPAMSYALNRLRNLLNDPLLVRTQQSMQPTARALTLVAPIRRAVAEIERIFQPVKEFDPAKSELTFTLATSDFADRVIIAPLLQLLAPYPLSLHVCSLDAIADSDESKANPRIDLALGHFNKPLSLMGWCSEILLHDKAVCVADSTYGNLQAHHSLSSYLISKHIAVAGSAAMQDPIDAELAPAGRKRRIIHTVSRYESAVLAIQQTDLLLTCPRLLADELLAGNSSLTLATTPPGLPDYSLRMQWPVQAEYEPATIWLRNQIRQIVQRRPAVTTPTSNEGNADGFVAVRCET